LVEEIIPQLYIYDSLDNKEHVLGIYSDLKKAFDTVDHSILLWKLNNYGMRGIVYDWFASYLFNRLQFTAVNGCSSCKLPVTCGIPQGSVLGPILFLINDLPNSIPGCNAKLFADDTNIFLSAKTLNKLEKQATYHLN